MDAGAQMVSKGLELSLLALLSSVLALFLGKLSPLGGPQHLDLKHSTSLVTSVESSLPKILVDVLGRSFIGLVGSWAHP